MWVIWCCVLVVDYLEYYVGFFGCVGDGVFEGFVIDLVRVVGCEVEVVVGDYV